VHQTLLAHTVKKNCDARSKGFSDTAEMPSSDTKNYQYHVHMSDYCKIVMFILQYATKHNQNTCTQQPTISQCTLSTSISKMYMI